MACERAMLSGHVLTVVISPQPGGSPLCFLDSHFEARGHHKQGGAEGAGEARGVEVQNDETASVCPQLGRQARCHVRPSDADPGASSRFHAGSPGWLQTPNRATAEEGQRWDGKARCSRELRGLVIGLAEPREAMCGGGGGEVGSGREAFGFVEQLQRRGGWQRRIR